MSPRPIDPAEAAALFEPLLARPLALAVSGGPDSMALLHLVAEWAACRGDVGEIVVMTIDHRLRPESAGEAAFVKAEAAKLGLPHVTLSWDGPKPETRIQERARAARYALIASHLATRSAGKPWTLAMAHHQDDQAETLAMRLARGSGVDGLAGMAPRTLLEIVPGHPMALVRPLLGMPKERLVATLTARGASWCVDPSNEAPEFERVRVRQAMAQLAPLGLTSAALARSAARLARAKDALDRTTDRLAREIVDDHGGAYATCDLAALRGAPDEIAIRLLRRLIIAFGEHVAGPELAQIETLHDWLAEGAEGTTQSLGGALVEVGRGRSLSVFREPGRNDLPTIMIAPGATGVWDGRFRVEVSATRQQPITVGPLGAADWADLKRAYPQLAAADLAHRAAVTLPTLRQDGRLLAVPILALAEPSLAAVRSDGAPYTVISFVMRRGLYGAESR